MTDAPRRGRWVVIFVVLLLASAAAFAIGVGVERAQVQSEAATTQTHTETGTDGDGAPSGETPTATTGSEAGAESLLGVNPESNAALIGALLASVALAAAVWWRPVRPLLLVGAVFCLAAAALDVREVTHQLNEHRHGIAALATLVLVLHLAATVAAIVAARQTSTASNGPQPAGG